MHNLHGRHPPGGIHAEVEKSYLAAVVGSTTHSRKTKKTTMFNRMISHFAGEDRKAARNTKQDAGLNSSYVRHLRRVYSDVYGK